MGCTIGPAAACTRLHLALALTKRPCYNGCTAKVVGEVYVSKTYENAFDWLRGMFGHLDTAIAGAMAMAKREHGLTPQCKGSGCSFCCYDVSGMSALEAAVAVDYAASLPAEDQEIIERQGRAYIAAHKADGTLMPVMANTDEPVFEVTEEFEAKLMPATRTSLRHNTPCMFLHPKTKACMIYEVRPFACRGHHQFMPPETCNERSETGSAFLHAVDLTEIKTWFYGSIRESGLAALPFGEIHAIIHKHFDAENPEFEPLPWVEYADGGGE
jgi:Fe-S-cluster containining protein